jgi:hypothetical protein
VRRTTSRNYHRGLFGIALLLIFGSSAAAQKQEYFSEGEIDLIRDAQYQAVELGQGKELPLRVAVYFRIADLRLSALGLKEKTAKEKELEKKAAEQHRKEVKEAEKAHKIPPRAVESPDDYLLDFNRSELMRGYAQALDEVMDNIDDAYKRKQDVRGSLEQLERYAREQVSIVKAFEPKTKGETAAKDAAIEVTQRALDESRAALEVVPKTEKTTGPDR